MARMILFCAACSSQNFVSAERRAAAEIPPRCWKCGEPLPPADETLSGTGESNNREKQIKPTGDTENA